MRDLRRSFTLAFVAMTFLAVACSPGSDEGAAPDGSSATSQPVADGPAPTSVVPDSPEVGQPLVGVKVDNAPASRPAVGLAQAVVLIEVEVEGGLTRFAALFSPDALPALVGPVRSVRPVDADLLSAFTGEVVSTGGRPWVVGELEAAGVRSIDEIEASGFVVGERQPPYGFFVDLGRLIDPSMTEGRAGLLRGSWVGGETGVDQVSVPFAEPAVWQFRDGAFVRPGIESLDGADGPGSPLTADTLVVLGAARRSAGYQDSAGADVPTFDVIGSGPLWVFHDGESVEARWSRAAQSDPFVTMLGDGEELAIPGDRIYVAVLDRELSPDF